MTANAPRRLPTGDAVFLDHLAHFVGDMDAAAASLGRLGFRATPFAVQENDEGGARVPAGTGNRCVMLDEGYLEILTAVSDTPLAEQLRAAIDRYEGVHLAAFSTADAGATHARLADAGFAVQAPVRLRRTLADGSGEAAFTVIRLAPGTMPEGRIQFLEHHTPELLWSPAWTGQPNGAAGLEGVVLCVDDAREAAGRFAAFLGRASVSVAGGFLVALERGFVGIVEPRALTTLLPGIEIPSLPFVALYGLHGCDPAASRAFFAGRGHEVKDLTPDLFAVPLPPPLNTTVTVGARGALHDWLRGRLGTHAGNA